MNRFLITTILCLMVVQAKGQEVLDRVLAVVNDEIILESEVLQYAQSLALQQGLNPMRFVEDEAAKAEILEGLIDQKVMLFQADQDSIVVESREVKRELDTRLNMMIEEVGSEEELEKIYGMSVREIRRRFEKNIREGLMVERLRQSKIMSVKTTRSDVERFYKEHKKQLYDRPEMVELAHIMLQVKPSQAAEEATDSLINVIADRLESGENFEELAKEYSEDGSAKKGGKLGWAKRGDFVPEFEETAFSLKTGDLSQPFRSRFGYHIVRLNERQGEKINTSHILIKLSPTDDDEKRVSHLADSLYHLLRGGEDFGELAVQYSDDVETASSGGNLGLFQVENLAPIFSDKVKGMNPGAISKPFRSQMGYQILKLVAREKPRPLTLENDWEQISEMALNKKREQVYLEILEKLKEEMYIDIRK